MGLVDACLKTVSPGQYLERHPLINSLGVIMRLLTICTFCVALLAVWPGFNTWASETHPFMPGERLVFELKWTFVPAGEAVLEVLPHEEVNGSTAYHFVMTANSNTFVDAFYKVRDRIDAYADVEMSGSILYRKMQREGSTKRDVEVIFDQKKLKAYYQSRGKGQKEIKIVPGTFDPLAVFFFARTLEISKGMYIRKAVSDGKKMVIGKAKVVRREKIRVPAGKFDTFLLEPELDDIGGVFEKSKDSRIQVWITADKRRIPVKIESAVSVGRFKGELVKATGLVK